MSSLVKRILSALVLGPVVIAAVWFGSYAFYALIAAVFIIGIHEWSRLSMHDGRVHWGILAAGIPYIAIACMAAIYLRGGSAGFYVLMYVFAAIWACDIGAYAFGKVIGGPKMAPHLSPNKTWAGMFGGALSSIIVVIAYDVFLENNIPGSQIVAEIDWPVHAVIGLILAFVGQAGDLLESGLKRRAGVKDSGNLIPGHGGLLDRIDALLLALPVFTAILLLMEYVP